MTRLSTSPRMSSLRTPSSSASTSFASYRYALQPNDAQRSHLHSFLTYVCVCGWAGSGCCGPFSR